MPRTALAALLAFGFLSTPAFAGRLPDGGVTVDEVAEVMQKKGVRAEISNESTEDGAVRIRSGLDGTNFFVRFFDCKPDGRCVAVQFVAAFDLPNGTTFQRANLWNSENRFGRAYLDDEMDPFVAVDADFERGATTEAIANEFEVWAAVMTRFKQFVFN